MYKFVESIHNNLKLNVVGKVINTVTFIVHHNYFNANKFGN